MQNKGQVWAIGVLIFIVAVVSSMVIYDKFFAKDDVPLGAGATPGTTQAAITTGQGVIVESLAVTQINSITKATEGGDDLEFWDKGADITDRTKSPRESLDLSSGTVTDTTVPTLRSAMTQEDMDLYIEGTGNYYDDKVLQWHFDYNSETGKGALVVDSSDSSYLEAVDVGTLADIDNPEAVDTGFTEEDTSAGVVNYTNSTGDGSAYIRLNLGNDEVDSVIRDFVLCIGDNDGDLEGDELTGLTVSLYSGTSIGSVPSNLLNYFSDAAGSSGTVCTPPVGDIGGKAIQKGVYQFDFSLTEANLGDSEELEICVDDLGKYNARDYPSANVKATAECLTIQFVP